MQLFTICFCFSPDKPSNTTLSSSAQNGVAIVEANVTFTCKTDALPAARYIFHHNGAMVQNSTSDKYVRTVECNVHNGNYSCEAVNFLGKDMSNIATLTVTGTYFVCFLKCCFFQTVLRRIPIGIRAIIEKSDICLIVSIILNVPK